MEQIQKSINKTRGENMNNRFKQGSGCFKCQSCGKLTRDVGYNQNYCPDCQDRLEHENNHADNDYVNDDCGDSECPIKHYSKEQRWWLNE